MAVAQKISDLGREPENLSLSRELDRARAAFADPFLYIPRRRCAIHLRRLASEDKTQADSQAGASEKRSRPVHWQNRIGALVAAQTLARDLGKNLARVDLSVVVSKYIGETEKNLRRVFAAVKGGGAVLFLDEADARFGKRTQVHESHDRYANIEINYLRKKIEEYAGVAILAINKRTGIDNALSRRFHFVIRVPPRRQPRRRQSPAR
jgi:hypothetical protein